VGFEPLNLSIKSRVFHHCATTGDCCVYLVSLLLCLVSLFFHIPVLVSLYPFISVSSSVFTSFFCFFLLSLRPSVSVSSSASTSFVSVILLSIHPSVCFFSCLYILLPLFFLLSLRPLSLYILLSIHPSVCFFSCLYILLPLFFLLPLRPLSLFLLLSASLISVSPSVATSFCLCFFFRLYIPTFPFLLFVSVFIYLSACLFLLYFIFLSAHLSVSSFHLSVFLPLIYTGHRFP
jgi:hypothetical protein